MSEGPSLSDRLERLPGYIVPAILLGVPLLFALASWAIPGFYENVIWKYYFGPIKADAVGRSLTEGGVTAHAGYNVVNTLSWAVLLGVGIVGAIQILRATRTRMDNTLIAGATAWVIAGSVWHVVEDTGLMERPLQYFFITPPIYLMFAAFGIISLLVGYHLERVEQVIGQERALQKLWFILTLGVLLYTLAWVAEWSQVVAFIHPVHVALFFALNYFVVRWRVVRSGRIERREMVLMLALAPLLMSIDYLVLFTEQAWSPSRPLVPSAFIAPVLLAAAAATIVWSTTRHARTGDRSDLRNLVLGFLLLAAVLFWVLSPLGGAGPVAVFLATLVGLFVLAWGVAWTLRHRVDVFAGTVLVLAALIATWLLSGLVGRIVGNVLSIEAGAWTWLVGLALVAALVWPQRKPLREGFARMREAGSARHASLAAFALPVNLAIVFSQSLDGFATALGIDIHSYAEKHVLSGLIISSFQDLMISLGWVWAAEHSTFLIFLPVKFLISLLVVYAIDIYSREDVQRYPNLIGFVKFAIIMVGIGPGVRNLVRMGMGV